MPFSPLGDMVIQQTFLTPTGLFLISMAIMYLITALLHPEEFCMFIIIVLNIISHFLCDVALCHVTFFWFCFLFFLAVLIIYGLMYFICIPSGYLLLTIYSLVNMNNVSWGTRETNK